MWDLYFNYLTQITHLALVCDWPHCNCFYRLLPYSWCIQLLHVQFYKIQFYNVHYSIFIAMRSSGSLERLHKYWPFQYCRNSLLFYMTICAITCLKLEHFKILHSFVIQKCINIFNQLHTLTLVLNKYHSLFPSVICEYIYIRYVIMITAGVVTVILNI